MDREEREMTFLARSDLSSSLIVDSGTHDGGGGRVGRSELRAECKNVGRYG